MSCDAKRRAGALANRLMSSLSLESGALWQAACRGGRLDDLAAGSWWFRRALAADRQGRSSEARRAEPAARRASPRIIRRFAPARRHDPKRRAQATTISSRLGPGPASAACKASRSSPGPRRAGPRNRSRARARRNRARAARCPAPSRRPRSRTRARIPAGPRNGRWRGSGRRSARHRAHRHGGSGGTGSGIAHRRALSQSGPDDSIETYTAHRYCLFRQGRARRRERHRRGPRHDAVQHRNPRHPP